MLVKLDRDIMQQISTEIAPVAYFANMDWL